MTYAGGCSILSLALIAGALYGLRNLDTAQRPVVLAVSASDPKDAIRLYTNALLREPAYAYHWAALGDAFLSANDIPKARICFRRALDLSPTVPQIWLRDANFHFSLDEPDAALRSSARVLKTVADYDGILFSYFDRLIANPTLVLREIGDDRRSSRSYTEFLIANNNPSAASTVWRHLADRHFTDDRLTASYIDCLLRHRHYDAATRDWVAHLGPRRGEYPDSNLLFNGSFETEPTGASIDWRVTPSAQFETTRDSSTAHHGRWSLRIRFSGKENVSYSNVIQQVPLRPGRYQFRLWIRTDQLTTNEGLRLDLTSADPPGRLSVRSAPITGNSAWIPLEQTFSVSEPLLLAVRLVRVPSEKFDNKIAGTVWVDSVFLNLLK